MDLTRVSAVAANIIRWKGEKSVDDGESEPAEGCPTETWQGFEKAARPRVFGKSRSLRR